MPEPDEEFIKEEADRIRGKLLHGYIYGMLVTEDADTDTLIVAAYHAGQSEAMLKHLEEKEELYGLLL